MVPSPREETSGEVPEPGRADGLGDALLDALECGVVACDAGGRLRYANPAAAALWSRADVSLGGEAWRCFDLCEEDGHQVGCDAHPLQRTMAEARPTSERLYITADGSEPFPVDVHVQPLGEDSPMPGGAVMTVNPHRESKYEARLRTYVSDFEILTEVSRLLADVQDAEEAASIICTVAIGSTGAVAVFLWELHDDVFALRWQEGMVSGDTLCRLTDEARRGAGRAIDERKTLVEHPSEGLAGPLVADEFGLTPGTAWHEPLLRGGQATGALSLVWPGVLTDMERPAWLIEALAHHAATALERATLVRRLNDAARTDPLTGLANRRVWNERLEHELVRAEREDSPISLVLIDMDRFKSYNDRHGHPEGDVLLAEAAVAWAAELRSTDLLARVGGEEFAVLLPSCPLSDAQLVAERLRGVTPRGETCSLGVAQWDGAMTASQLYATADEALYQAKKSGRNQVRVGGMPGEDALPLAS
jgi:diguanylate cyclase (GGDEF)-like protein